MASHDQLNLDLGELHEELKARSLESAAMDVDFMRGILCQQILGVAGPYTTEVQVGDKILAELHIPEGIDEDAVNALIQVYVEKARAALREQVVNPPLDKTDGENARDIVVERAGTLIEYQIQYELWNPEDKGKITWEEIRNRLLANDRAYLKLGHAMENHGVLFGIDDDNNPLIADGGDVPIMCGMSYKDTRALVHRDGYELFGPAVENYWRELQRFQIFTGKPFIQQKNNVDTYSWLESGADLSIAFTVSFAQSPNPGCLFAHICSGEGTTRGAGAATTGVRRLLRVEMK